MLAGEANRTSPMQNRLSACLLLAVLAGAATAGRAEERRPAIYSPPRAPDRIAEVSALMGLTADEIRRQLRLQPVDYDYVSEARIEADGAETRVRSARDLAASGGLCARWSDASITLREGETRDAMARYAFRDGVLVAVRGRADEAPVGAQARLEVFCHENRERGPGYAIPTMIVYAPFIVLGAIGDAPRIGRHIAGLEALADLRLGEAPPGGLAAYRADPPGAVTVRDLEDGATLLTVTLGGRNWRTHPDKVLATVRDGVVVSLAKDRTTYILCALTSERTLRCDVPR